MSAHGHLGREARSAAHHLADIHSGIVSREACTQSVLGYKEVPNRNHWLAMNKKGHTAKAQNLRDAILAAPLVIDSSQATSGMLYLPALHTKALALAAPVVIGAAGTGKSFLASALLQSEPLRAQLNASVPDLHDTPIRAGFSIQAAHCESFPDASIFQALLAQNGDPFDLWRAIIFRWAAHVCGTQIPDETWLATVMWVRRQPEDAARLIQHAAQRDKVLFIFDSVEQISDDAQSVDAIVRGLLRALLWLTPFKTIYAKAFLSSQQASRTVWNFPDASKIHYYRCELDWAPCDLHGLLWQRLVNAPSTHGALARSICTGSLDVYGAWQIPAAMREEVTQRPAFKTLSTAWQKRDGKPRPTYSGVIKQAADDCGQVSPRAFLSAIRAMSGPPQ